ncbi:MAG: SurA N-terminal domain-containing protein [Kiritimatiellae bacterium]|nr:SurA N-terminal domain-containing protein [Kiritimatiellia bacterium]
MLISKFHKIIGNKWLWAAFAILMSLVLVGLFTPGMNSGQEERVLAAGKLYGLDIAKSEYNIAEYFEKGLVSDKTYDQEEYKQLQKQTWQRLAALKTAPRMGIIVTEQEVLDAIKNDRTFANSAGQFDKTIFNQIMMQIRLSPEIYTEYVKQQLIIYKVKKQLESEVWLPPTLIEEKLSDLTDLITVKAGLVSNVNFTNNVKVTDELISAYYDENKEIFETPEKISVKYIKWSNDDVAKTIEITQEQTANYYTNYIDDFSVADTNNNLVPMPLKDVQDKIVAMLKNRAAQNQLIDTASYFTRKLEPVAGKSEPFETVVAKETDLSVSTSGLFSAQSKIAGLSDVEPNDVQMLFALDQNDPWRCFSDPVVTEKDVYIFAANEKIAPKIPELAELKETISFYVKQDELGKLTKEKAEEFIAEIEKEVAAGKSFEQAAKALDIETFNAGTFMSYQGITNNVPYADTISRLAISVEAGKASEPVEIPSGAIFAFVEKRTEGEPIEKELVRPQLLSSLTKYRADITYPAWGQSILDSKEADFQNFMDQPEENEAAEKELVEEETGI